MAATKAKVAKRQETEITREVTGYEFKEATVKPGYGLSASGRLYVPADWIGSRVLIIKTDP